MGANRQMLDGADACWNGYFLYPTPAWGRRMNSPSNLGLSATRRFLHAYLNYACSPDAIAVSPGFSPTPNRVCRRTSPSLTGLV